MKLSHIVNEESIIVDLKGDQTKTQIITRLVDVLYAHQRLGDEEVTRDEVIAALMQREAEQTTAIGEGFAFPHARFSGVRRFYMAVGICKDGVDFDSMDEAPTHFFVITLVAQSKANVLLQARAAMMSFMMPQAVRDLMMSSKSVAPIWQALDESAAEVNNDILAKDIMRPNVGSITPTSTLHEAACMLHKYHIDSLPIIDVGGKFCGEISGFDLFAMGLPNFFFNLKKIAFVKHMDPFEKYFQADTTMDVMEMLKSRDRKFPVIKPGATLIEIVFELTAHDRHILYVVEDDKLLGVIDRFSIVDKILVAED